MSGTFTARFPGECGACGERVRIGDQMTYAESVAVHIDCDDVVPERPVTICPMCYMTTCDCERTP